MRLIKNLLLALAAWALAGPPALAAQVLVKDVHLNNQRGPLSVLVKLSDPPVGLKLKPDGKTYVLVLEDTALEFQQGKTSKITVGGLGLEQIDVYPVTVEGREQVRLELLLQPGYTVVDRTEPGLSTVRLDVLATPGAAPAKPKPATPAAKPPAGAKTASQPPGLPPLPRLGAEVAPPPRLPPDAVRPGPPTEPPVVDAQPQSPAPPTSRPDADDLLRTNAAAAGPAAVEAIEAKMMATRISSLSFRRAEIDDVLTLLAIKGNFNVVIAPGLQGKATLTLNNVTVKEALDLLARLNKFQYKVYENTVLVTAATRDEGLEPLQTELLELSYASPDSVKTMVEGLELIDKGKIQTMPATATGGGGSQKLDTTTTNILLVKETAANLRLIRQVAEKLDRKPRQVQVAVRFVEMEEGALKAFFSNPQITRSKGSRRNAQSGISFNEGIGLGSLQLDIIGHHKGFNLDALLNWQNSQSHLEVIAEPTLITLDGQKGEVDLTEKTGFFTTGATANTTGNTQTRQTIDFGVKMLITPRIDREEGITMLVEPEVTTPGERGVDGLPNEKTKKVKLTVRVKSGETLMVGGLIQEEYEEVIRKAPILGDLPLIKKLFRSRSRDKTKKELVIFVTPTILEAH